MPTSRTRTPRVEQRLPRGVAVVGSPPKSTKLASLGTGSRPIAVSSLTIRSRCCLDGVDRVEHELGVGERGQRHRLGLRAEVVRHAHQAQRVDQVWVGGEVSQPAPARAKALLIVRVTTSRGRPVEQGQGARGARAGELRVGLVDDDERVGGRLDARPRRRRAREPCPSGCSGEHRNTTSGIDGSPDLLDRGGRLEVEGCPTVRLRACPSTQRGARRRRDDRVHRVGRGEAERGPSRTTEGLEQVQEHLVGAVGRPTPGGINCSARCRERYATSASRRAVNSRSG
jgi:hypothetical protein